jgi:hypothetical protein
LANIIERASSKPEPALTKFDLDFHGGTPRELVAAIEKAMGRPLNAIVPDDLVATRLSALKMNSVDVSQLFAALLMASRKSETVPNPGYGAGYGSYQISQTSCGFKTEGRPSDDSIWCFFVEKPPLPPVHAPQKVCRFYSLAPYLQGTATVDHITSAVQTGWKMLGDASPPSISFDKDTKLLIAVGEPNKLETIDAVLKALQTPESGGFGRPTGATPMRAAPPQPADVKPPAPQKRDQ